MNLFNELKKAASETQNNLKNSVEDSVEHEKYSDMLQALKSVADYIKAGTWCKNKASHNRVMVALRAKNYAEAAEALGTSQESVRASVYQASQRIRELVGFDVIGMILRGGEEMEAALTLFKIQTDPNACRDLLLKDVMDNLLEHYGFEKFDRFNKPDKKKLMDALYSLRYFSKEYTTNRLESLSPEILSYVAYIISSDEQELLPIKAIVHQYFSMDLCTTELEERLKLIEQ